MTVNTYDGISYVVPNYDKDNDFQKVYSSLSAWATDLEPKMVRGLGHIAREYATVEGALTEIKALTYTLSEDDKAKYKGIFDTASQAYHNMADRQEQTLLLRDELKKGIEFLDRPTISEEDVKTLTNLSPKISKEVLLLQSECSKHLDEIKKTFAKVQANCTQYSKGLADLKVPLDKLDSILNPVETQSTIEMLTSWMWGSSVAQSKSIADDTPIMVPTLKNLKASVV